MGLCLCAHIRPGSTARFATVDLVARALRDQGAAVRFIYSWDDFDVFRKVPVDMPEQAMLEENLRRSIVDVPDPYGEHASYADHHIAALEASIVPLGIAPEFIRQASRYRAGDYAEGIRRALEARESIRAILDRHRTTPLAPDWLPLAGFCDACGRDDLDFAWDGEWGVAVGCRGCGHAADVDLRKGGNLKLPWRVDWPMRWAAEQVVFEPGGKDHSSAGGSYDTGREIVREVYAGVAPEYVAYDFVRIKGRGGKISSSKGEAITVADALEAATLDLPYPHVYGVATFYTMFRREPAGTNVLRVCTNISCMLRGAYEVLAAFERELGVEVGGSNEQFHLVEEECIAACANAPAVLCGTEYFLDVTPDQVGDIVQTLKRNPHPESEVV